MTLRSWRQDSNIILLQLCYLLLASDTESDGSVTFSHCCTQEVMEVLKEVKDPGLGKDIVAWHLAIFQCK